MTRINSHITDQAANYEFLAAVIASIGMIVMMISPLIGKLLISLGIAGLIILYFLQFFIALNHKSQQTIILLTLNHISMIIVLAGMMMCILKSEINLYVLLLGWTMMIITCGFNIWECKLAKKKLISVKQIRFFILAVVSMIFFIGF